MARVKMLTNTYDEYQGLLRPGDEKNVPQETAERWEKHGIAKILDIPVKDKKEAKVKKEVVTDCSNTIIEEVKEEATEEVKVEKPTNYHLLSRKELTDLAIAKGIEVTRATKTATIIEKLEA